MGFSEQARLSELHRLAQTKLQTVVAGDVAKAFPLLDAANVDASFGKYFGEMKRVINARRTLSSSLSSTLYEGIRKDAGITSLFTPILNTAVNDKQLFTSLLVTGPVSIKKSLEAGATLEQAHANALTSTIRASQRHVANGGRETITKSVKRDKAAKGWARLTDGKPCSFCAMLASRGPVYKSEQTSHFRSHDGCGCTAVPVFDLAAPWPGRAEEFRAAYDENISGKFAGGDGNNDAVKAWRKFYDTKLEPTPFNAAKNISEELVAKAKAFEPELTTKMQELADRNGGTLQGLDYRVKTSESLTRKIAKDVSSSNGTLSVEDAAAKMFDVNRYTMQIEEKGYSKGAQAVIDELRAGGNTVKVKNYWLVDDNPYQGINIQVTSKTGQQYELQFHTPKSLEIKEGALHDIYELARKTKDPVKLARFNERSFAAAQSIPVPRGVEGIRSGLGDEIAKVVKVVKAPKVKPAADVPAYRAAWDEAVAKLPADRGQIGRKSLTPDEIPKPVDIARAQNKLNAINEFADEWTRIRASSASSSAEAVAREEALTKLETDFKDKYGVDFRAGGNFSDLVNGTRRKYQIELKDLMDKRSGGPLDIIERGLERSSAMTQAAGPVLNAHLDAVLDAGKILGAELDERIAKRIAAFKRPDVADIQAAFDARMKVYHAETEEIQTAMRKINDDIKIETRAQAMRDYENSGFSVDAYHEKLVRLARARNAAYQQLLKKQTDIDMVYRREQMSATNAIKSGTEPIKHGTTVYADIQREETMKLLSELREMGGKGADYVAFDGRAISDTALTDAMEFAHQSYPTSWMDAVRTKYPQVVLESSSRGFNRMGVEISLSRATKPMLTGDIGYRGVALHELGHSMQRAVPGLQELDFAYRSRRATIINKQGAEISEKTRGIDGSRKEVSMHDNWRHSYSGRVYGGIDAPFQIGEVFTTGIESILGGSTEYFRALAPTEKLKDSAKLLFDNEFRNYMLGVLSVL